MWVGMLGVCRLVGYRLVMCTYMIFKDTTNIYIIRCEGNISSFHQHLSRVIVYACVCAWLKCVHSCVCLCVCLCAIVCVSLLVCACIRVCLGVCVCILTLKAYSLMVCMTSLKVIL